MRLSEGDAAAKIAPHDTPLMQLASNHAMGFEPLAFPKNPAPKVPLEIGIFEDLVHARRTST